MAVDQQTILGENIRHYRKQKKMTQDMLADKLYIDRAAISRYENGTNGVMGILCRKAALTTAGKETEEEPSFKQKYRILDAEHSPIRLLNFTFCLKGIPYYVSNHLVRHHVGCTPFVRSQRNDRQSLYDRNSARQDAPVDMMWQLNAQSLIDVSHKRLCSQADPITRGIVQEMCEKVIEKCPEFRDFLVPECEYRGHWCHEIKSCGRCMKAPAPWE